MLSQLRNDFRYAARRLGSSPGFTAAAVLTIALGVGINTGIFSVLNAVALRDLPAVDAEELVSVHQILDDETRVQRDWNGSLTRFSTSEYRTYRDSARTLSGIMAYSSRETVTLGGDTPQEITGQLVTCNYFDVLRQPPALGPGFTADNCEAEGAAPTVVLSNDLWRGAFNADTGIIGREVLLNRHAFTVVGVASAGVRGVDIGPAVSYFAPIATQPLLRPSTDMYGGEWNWLALVGRKNDGATLAQVRAELGVIAAGIDAEQPPRKTTLVVDRARVSSEPEERAQVMEAGGLIMTAFGCVLLIACANVANLLLARAMGRAREIAVRRSLGASRARIVQQLLAESVLIGVIGGLLGSLLALWSFQSLVYVALSALPAEVPSLAIDASPDGRVLAFALVLTLASSALFGLMPALEASKADLHTAMKADSAGAAPRASGRWRGVFLGLQVALCMVLIVVAGLLLRGLRATQVVEPGFAYENVAVASFDLTAAGYDAERSTAFERRLLERVGSLPGIEAVAQAAITPLTPGGMGITVSLPGTQQPFPILINVVSASYFSVIELPIVRGRTFHDAEIANGGAIIVTESTARRLWPDRDPIGQTLTQGALGPAAGSLEIIELRVVGVAKDAQITGIGEPPPSNFVYLPATPGPGNLQLLAKSGVDFASTAAAIRAAFAEIDPALVVRVTPLESNLELWRSLAGVASTLSSSLGVLALALAAVGVYGVVAYAVGRRVREIGVRIALGATARNVVALMLKRTMRPIVIGAAVGVAAALGVSSVLESVLFGVSPADPLAFAAATLVVAGVAVAASVLPARRAARIDPMNALRYE